MPQATSPAKPPIQRIDPVAGMAAVQGLEAGASGVGAAPAFDPLKGILGGGGGAGGADDAAGAGDDDGDRALMLGVGLALAASVVGLGAFAWLKSRRR